MPLPFHDSLKLSLSCVALSMLGSCSFYANSPARVVVLDKPITAIPRIDPPLEAKVRNHPGYLVRVIYPVLLDQALAARLAEAWRQHEAISSTSEIWRVELDRMTNAQATLRLNDAVNKSAHLAAKVYDELIKEFGKNAIALVPGRIGADFNDNTTGPIRLFLPDNQVPAVVDLEIFVSRKIVDPPPGDALADAKVNTFGQELGPAFILSTSVDAKPSSGGAISSSPISPTLHAAKFLSQGRSDSFKYGYSYDQYLARTLGFPFFDCGYGNVRQIEDTSKSLAAARGSETLQLPPISLISRAGEEYLRQEEVFSSAITAIVKQSLNQIDHYLAMREPWRRYIAEFDPELASRWPNISTTKEWDRLSLIKAIMHAEREFLSIIDGEVAKLILEGPIGSSLKAQRLSEVKFHDSLPANTDSGDAMIQSRFDLSLRARSIISSDRSTYSKTEEITKAVNALVRRKYSLDADGQLEADQKRTVYFLDREMSFSSFTELRNYMRELYSKRYRSNANVYPPHTCRVVETLEREIEPGWNSDNTFFRGNCEAGLAEGPGVSESGLNGVISSRQEAVYKAGRATGLSVGWVSYFLKKDGKPGERQRSVPDSCESLLYVGGSGVSWHPENSNYTVHRSVSQRPGEDVTWEVSFDRAADARDRGQQVQILERERPRLLAELEKWAADRQRLIALGSDPPASLVAPAPAFASGTAPQARVVLASVTEADLARGRFAAQVGAFRIRESAYSLRDQVAGELAVAQTFSPAERMTRVLQRGKLYLVLVGDVTDAAAARALASRIRRATSQDVILFRR